MTTSTEQISSLIASNVELKAFFEGERDRIEEARAAAFGSMRFNIYVDPVGGNDVTGVGTQGEPFRTLQAAIDAADPMGDVTVRLLNDLHFEDRINGPLGGRLRIFGSKADETKAVITFADEAGNKPGSAPGIEFPDYALNRLTFTDVHLKLRQFDAGHASRSVVTRRGFTAVNFLLCEVEALAGCNQYVIGAGGGFGIHMAGSTHVGMAGYWAEGIASGADPVTVKECAYSTMSSL